MSKHKIVKCEACGITLIACRCTGPHEVEWRAGPCAACAEADPPTSVDAERMRDGLKDLEAQLAWHYEAYDHNPTIQILAQQWLRVVRHALGEDGGG